MHCHRVERVASRFPQEDFENCLSRRWQLGILSMLDSIAALKIEAMGVTEIGILSKSDRLLASLQHNVGCREISRRIWRPVPPPLEAFFPRCQDRSLVSSYVRPHPPHASRKPSPGDQKQSTFRNIKGSIQLFENDRHL